MSTYDVEREDDNHDSETGVRPITMDAVISEKKTKKQLLHGAPYIFFISFFFQ